MHAGGGGDGKDAFFVLCRRSCEGGCESRVGNLFEPCGYRRGLPLCL